jgi:hypothetical protein
MSKMWNVLLVTGLALGGCSADTGPTEDGETGAGTSNTTTSAAPQRAPRQIPSGTTLTFAIGQTVSASGSQSGQTFVASLAQPVVVNGETVIPAGAAAEGRILEATQSGRVRGVAEIALTMTGVTVQGRMVDISTAPFEARAETSRTEDAATIGVGAGVGAALGGILGGGDGAALGAAIGGGGGTAVVLSTRGDDLELPSGTAVNFVLSQTVDLP